MICKGKLLVVTEVNHSQRREETPPESLSSDIKVIQPTTDSRLITTNWFRLRFSLDFRDPVAKNCTWCQNLTKFSHERIINRMWVYCNSYILKFRELLGSNARTLIDNMREVEPEFVGVPSLLVKPNLQSCLPNSEVWEVNLLFTFSICIGSDTGGAPCGDHVQEKQ